MSAAFRTNPPAGLGHRPPDISRARRKLIVGVIFLALLGFAFFVIILLPEQVSKKAAQPTLPDHAGSTVAPAPAASDAIAEISNKPEAEKLLAEALRRLASLESEGARIWGAEDFHGSLPEAQAALDRATSLYDRQQYASSLPLFRDAIAALEQVASGKPLRLRAAIERGMQAFEALDASVATQQFEIAVALSPGDGATTTTMSASPVVHNLFATPGGRQQVGFMS